MTDDVRWLQAGMDLCLNVSPYFMLWKYFSGVVM